MQQVIKENELSVQIAKIDMQVHKDFAASKYYIQQAPMVMFFKYDKFELSHFRHERKEIYYTGPMRAEDIFVWTTQATYPPTRAVECEKLINPEDQLNRVVLYYGDLDAKEYKMAMVDVGHHGVVGRRFSFFHITDDECAKQLGFTKKPQLMQIRDMISPTPSIYEGEWHPISIMKWLWAAATPTVFEFSQETYELGYYQELPQIILFRMLDWDDLEDYEVIFGEIASKNQGDYLFITSGLSEQIQQQIGSMLGVEYKDLPTIRIIDL